MSAWAQRESMATRWTRRAVSVPAVCCAFVVYLSLLPIALAVTLAADAIAALRRRRDAWTRGLLAVGALLLAEVAGLVALGFAWVATLGRPAAALTATYAIQTAWASFLFAALRTLFSLRVTVRGAQEAARGPVLIYARHTSIFDTIVPIVALQAPFGLRMRYVMKRELLWDPCLDVAGQRLPNRFVRRGSSNPAAEIEGVVALGRELGPRDALLIYPEGTRYTPSKAARALARIREAQAELAERAEQLRHVLPPRPGGPVALLGLGHDVAMMAHRGFDGVKGWRDVWNGALVGREVVVEFWRVPASDVPAEEAARPAWLLEAWLRMDAWVDAQPGAGGRPENEAR